MNIRLWISFYSLFLSVNLFSQQLECLKTLSKHDSPIESMAIKGRLLYSGDFGGAVQCWLLPEGEWKYSIDAHRNRINTIDIDQTGTYMLTAGSDWSVKVWRGKEKLREYYMTANVSFALFSTDGQKIYYGCHDGNLYCIDWKAGGKPYIVYNDKFYLTSGYMIHQKGLLLFSSGYTNKFFSLRKQRVIGESPNCSDYINQSVFDGRSIISWCEDGTLNRFGYKDGALRKLNTVNGGERGYSKIGISKKSKKAITGNEAGNINVWSLPDLKPLLKLSSHDLTVKQALIFDESDYLITSSYDDKIKIWGVKKPEEPIASNIEKKKVAKRKSKPPTKKTIRRKISKPRLDKPAIENKTTAAKKEPEKKIIPQSQTVKKVVPKPPPMKKLTPKTRIDKKDIAKESVATQKKTSSFYDSSGDDEDTEEDELSWLDEAVENEGPKRIDKNRISDPEVYQMIEELEILKGSPLTSDVVDEFIMDKDIVNRDIDIQHTITVYDKELIIDVWDHQKEDGDRISLYLNDVLILDNHLLKREKKKVKIKLLEDEENQLRLFALNLGHVPPNTASIRIVQKEKTHHVILKSDLKTCGTIEINYEPRD